MSKEMRNLKDLMAKEKFQLPANSFSGDLKAMWPEGWQCHGGGCIDSCYWGCVDGCYDYCYIVEEW